jgi:hypothetical protein
MHLIGLAVPRARSPGLLAALDREAFVSSASCKSTLTCDTLCGAGNEAFVLSMPDGDLADQAEGSELPHHHAAVVLWKNLA